MIEAEERHRLGRQEPHVAERAAAEEHAAESHVVRRRGNEAAAAGFQRRRVGVDARAGVVLERKTTVGRGLVAGGQARIPTSLFRGVRTMTMNIVLEMGYAAGLHREALVATGAILFIFILLINLAFVLSKRKKVK